MLSIRRFAVERLGIADLLRIGTLTEPVANLLRAVVLGRLNVVISGGTGAGKTTMLNVLYGKLVDIGFHKYVNPIPEFNSWQQLSEHIDVTPPAVTQGSGPTTLKVRGRGFWPFHQVLLNGRELETRFVSRNELDAVLPPEAIQDAGMYKVTVKSRGEPVAESNPAPLVVGFKP
jgi:hypothetical protein